VPAVPNPVSAESGRLDQQRAEPPHPPMDRDVVDVDATLGE
jgi:hypothetical protein